MTEVKPKGYWKNKENCAKAASECSSRREFSEKYNAAYNYSRKQDWLVDICVHMEDKYKPPGYWTLDKLQETALKYSSRMDFKDSEHGAYSIACRSGVLDAICSHMNPIGNRHKRLIYAYLFSDNSIYIGLTYDIEARHSQHLSNLNSAVYNHISATGLEPERITLTKLIPTKEASELEKKYVDEYRSKGYNILNRRKADGIGGRMKVLRKYSK